MVAYNALGCYGNEDHLSKCVNNFGSARQSEATASLSAGKKLLFALILLVLLVVGGELAGRVLYAARSDMNRYMRQAYYRNRDWSESYWRAHTGLHMRYEPYCGWRRQDIPSEHINITNGERRTVHAKTPTDDAIDVWCFGGSAMWGTGVRDGATIPSQLAKLAGERGYDVRVRNLGESGWVSTQEAILLDRKLRSGEIPDVVLFYDGVNDTFSAFQSGRADGAHQNLDIFEQFFETGHDPRRSFVSQLAIVRGIGGLSKRLGIEWQPPTKSAESRESLADAVAQVYTQNVAWVRKRAEEYGFKVLFAWQPVVSWQADYLTVESDAYHHMSHDSMDAMLAFYEETTARVSDADVMVMRRCLGASPEDGYFIDHNHVGEEANALLAGCLFERLESMLQEQDEMRGGA